VSPNLTNMREFLTSPLPKNNGTLQCYIRRNKSGTNKLFPIYSLYLKVCCVYAYIGVVCSTLRCLTYCALFDNLTHFTPPHIISHRRATCF